MNQLQSTIQRGLSGLDALLGRQEGQERVNPIPVYTILAFALLLAVGAALYALNDFRKAVQIFSDLIQIEIREAELAREIELATELQVVEFKNILLRGQDSSAFQEHSEAFEKDVDLVNAEIREFESLLQRRSLQDVEKVSGQLNQFKVAHADMTERFRDAMRTFQEQITYDPGIVTQVDLETKGIDKPVIAIMAQVAKDLDNLAAEEIKREKAIAARDTVITTGVIIAVVIVAILLYGLLVRFFSMFNEVLGEQARSRRDAEERNRSMQKDLQRLLVSVADASDGDLTVRVRVTEGIFGNVADAFNLLLEQIGELLEDVVSAASRVNNSAVKITASTEQMASGSGRQVSEIVNTTSALQEMSANIESVSDNAETANEATQKSLEAAKQGQNSVTEVVQGMERIRESAQSGAKKIKRLGESSMKISTIANTIENISAQTDMLALNAAIEAARAGEHGRGFSVVAAEVRKLAERTADSTKEIEQLISGIQVEINEAVTSMERQTSEVEEEAKVVAAAGSQLVEIERTANQSAELVSDISVAAKQQVRGAASVVEAMQSVSDIAEQAQSGSSETLLGTQELTDLSQALNKQLDTFTLSTNGNGHSN
ncbi:MAG: methyl-accepting chemotaxis protein [Verrucomicrobiota bacterium]